MWNNNEVIKGNKKQAMEAILAIPKKLSEISVNIFKLFSTYIKKVFCWFIFNLDSGLKHARRRFSTTAFG